MELGSGEDQLLDGTRNGPIMVRMKTLTVSKAKARLGPLTDSVARTGRPVLIRRAGRIFELRERPMIEPIDMPAVGDLPVGAAAIKLQELVGEPVGPEVLGR